MPRRPSGPNFDYWSKLSFWTIEQSTALLIGADPDKILDGGSLSASCLAETRDRYRQMFRLLDSHIRMSGVGSNFSPTEAIEWALHAKVDPPGALVAAVQDQGLSLNEKRARKGVGAVASPTDEKPLTERERNTLLRIIIGMAIAGYGYDPDAKRSDIAKSIADDLSDLGLDCSDQSVREKLREARELLPFDWKGRKAGKSN